MPARAFQPYVPGAALADADAPRTPKQVPHRGGPANPSADALRAHFGEAVVRRVDVVWGETSVWIDPARARDVVRWLKENAEQRYEYLVDVTAVEHRDAARPLEVVWHLRSLAYRRFLRLKAELPRGGRLEVPSIVPVHNSANWLEREVYDMFGIAFADHPDPRRILMWETYREGHPLRKDFPLRGRFSRAEQLRQALTTEPRAHYSMEEITVAEAFAHLPADMRARLGAGERGGPAERHGTE